MNICVIGLGSMGRRRIKLLQMLAADSVIMGVDNDLKRAENVAREYEIDCYSALKDINMDMDCAFVCTSPQFHGSIIQECLNRGMHVFTEINLISELYDENIQLAKKKGKILFLSSTPLYKREMQIINEKVQQDGTICAYQYHVGQYLPDWHPWDDLNRFFVSNKKTNGCRELLAIELPWIQNTFGKIERVNVIKRKLTDLNLEFPDTYLIQIEHQGGNVGNMVVDVVSRHAVRSLEIMNEHLYIRWDGTPESLYQKDLESGKLKQIPAGQYIHEDGYGHFINEYAYAKEMEEFFKALEESREPLYGFKEDKEILKIIDEIEM